VTWRTDPVAGRTAAGYFVVPAHTDAVCLTGADLPTAQRFLRAQVLTVEAGRRDRAGTRAGGSW
jgi:hypothetical protein